jgi:hypothetical protein
MPLGEFAFAKITALIASSLLDIYRYVACVRATKICRIGIVCDQTTTHDRKIECPVVEHFQSSPFSIVQQIEVARMSKDNAADIWNTIFIVHALLTS